VFFSQRSRRGVLGTVFPPNHEALQDRSIFVGSPYLDRMKIAHRHGLVFIMANRSGVAMAQGIDRNCCRNGSSGRRGSVRGVASYCRWRRRSWVEPVLEFGLGELAPIGEEGRTDVGATPARGPEGGPRRNDNQRRMVGCTIGVIIIAVALAAIRANPPQELTPAAEIKPALSADQRVTSPSCRTSPRKRSARP